MFSFSWVLRREWRSVTLSALALASLSFVQGTTVMNLLAVSGIALACLGYFALRVFRPALVGMAVYLVAHACVVPFLYWGGDDVGAWFQISLISTRKTLLLGVMFLAAYSLRHVKSERFFVVVVSMGAVMTMLGQPLLPTNPSLDAALLVAGFAMAPGPVTFIMVLAISLFWNRGITAPAMLLMWCAARGRIWSVLSAILGGLAYLVVTIIRSPEVFTAKGDRFEMYVLAWRHFIQSLNIFVGAGLDSFLILGPKIQAPGPLPWTKLHSSWLQIPFELGLVGLALASWLYVDAVWRSGKRERDALLLLGLCAVGYYPAQVPLFLAFGIWLVVRAETKEGAENEKAI